MMYGCLILEETSFQKTHQSQRIRQSKQQTQGFGAVYDLKAIVDYIKNIIGVDKINYIYTLRDQPYFS
jgi:hypothetical protein